MQVYVIQSGDTLGLIAQKFTGNRDRWIELLDSNPRIPQVRDQYGQRTFDPSYIRLGGTIYLPDSWTTAIEQMPLYGNQYVNQLPWQYGNQYPWQYGMQYGNQYGWGQQPYGGFPNTTQSNTTTRSTGYGSSSQRSGGLMYGPRSGQVGDSCSPAAVPFYPGVLYIVHDGMMPAQVAASDFHQVVGQYGDAKTMTAANVGFWKQGFVLDGTVCVPAGWADGIALRVPKAWLDLPPTQLNALPALGHLVLEDGVTPWTPPKTATPGTPGTQGNCQDGYVLGADGVTCIPKGTGNPVVATTTSTGVSSWVWIALAAGAGIGGALLLNNLIKSKKVHAAPPSAPALPAHKEEVVVRR